jgi:hypothetical protein
MTAMFSFKLTDELVDISVTIMLQLTDIFTAMLNVVIYLLTLLLRRETGYSN